MGTRRLVKIYLVVEVDHPHACGDKYYNTDGIYTMWGQVQGLTVARVTGRIIPTRVGTRSGLLHPKSTYWDHPHACGDKISTYFLLKIFSGSSPRVWGQAKHCDLFSVTLRIIPTRVGTRFSVILVVVFFEDHPHACGDKTVT